MNSITLPREVVELHIFASKDNNRPDLQYVYIHQKRPGRLLAVASDGWRMGQFEFDGILAEPIFVDAYMLKNLKVVGPVVIQYKTVADGMHFPDYEKVTPAIDAGMDTTRICFNPKFMVDAVTWAKRSGLVKRGGYPTGVAVTLTGADKAMRVTLGDVAPDFVYVVMPMRI